MNNKIFNANTSNAVFNTLGITKESYKKYCAKRKLNISNKATIRLIAELVLSGSIAYIKEMDDIIEVKEHLVDEIIERNMEKR